MTIQLGCVGREGGRKVGREGEGNEGERGRGGGREGVGEGGRGEGSEVKKGGCILEVFRPFVFFFLCRSGTCVTCVLLWTLSDRIVV